ncbi:MAG TPA: hypothetical protein VHK88_20225 [Aquihabitans sp.]|jgi:peptidoglycan hydrolase CwlO-like protein|nr:hypothetical protein [Aquihabitans sp.]
MNPTMLTTILAVLGGGGLLTAFAVWRKAGPESSQILVDAASGVVLIQKGVIDDLRADMDVRDRRIDAIEAALVDRDTRIKALEAALAERDREVHATRAENDELRQRVKHLEAEVLELKENGNA